MRARILAIVLGLAPLDASLAQSPASAESLLSGCAQISLQQCRLSTRVVNFDKLTTYSKAFNCMKYGSTSGDNFSLNLPIPDLGALGFNFGSSAQNSREVCVEEIKKLDSARFFSDFSDTFDQECGRTLAGQYQQCVEAATSMGTSSQIQNLSCSAVQARNSVIINTRYVPGAMEGPNQYKIRSVNGIDGIGCEGDVYAGVNQYTSFSCTLPADHQGGNLNVRLNNGVSCSVNIGMPVALAIEQAQKYNCSTVFSEMDDGADGMPMILQSTISGLCDVCFAKNLRTGPTDSRSVSNRLKSCAVWSAYALMQAEAQFCMVEDMPHAGGGMVGGVPYGGGGVMTSRPNTRISMSGGVQNPANDTPLSMPFNRPNACADIPAGSAISLQGKDWEQVPIDFLGAGRTLSPQIAQIVADIEAYFKDK